MSRNRDGKIDLGLTGLDNLFSTQEERDDALLARIRDIPLTLIDDFPNHPFKVRDDEDMLQLAESVKERGVMTPVLLRPKGNGRYEMVSGHRRRRACELAGLDTIKAEVREMTRDEAVILMVESNLQRSVILPSEKAFSYKMRLEAMKRQGQRTDLTLSPMGTKFGRSSSEITAETGDSKNQIYRYIRLTYLVPELLSLVDKGRVGLRPAVELSYLKTEEQKYLYRVIAEDDVSPTLTQARELRGLSAEGKLSDRATEDIMAREKPNQREKIRVSYDRAERYIPPNLTPAGTEDYIIEALKFYDEHLRIQEEREQGSLDDLER